MNCNDCVNYSFLGGICKLQNCNFVHFDNQITTNSSDIRNEVIEVLNKCNVLFNQNDSTRTLIKILKNSDGINWSNISICQGLSEDFIREFKNKVDWIYISIWQTLSESFIREFKDKVSWEHICQWKVLSEDFIREFKDKVYWGDISINQKLSESFIREFKDNVDWYYIYEYQDLSEDFRKDNL